MGFVAIRLVSKHLSYWYLVLVCIGVVGSSATGQTISWKRVELDAKFRAEGVAAADVDRDGAVDILAGDVWYQAPDWTLHEIRKVGDYVPDKGYSQCFASFTYDVNRDGWQDYLVIGFPGAPCHWYENPRQQEKHWEEHLICLDASNESPQFRDLTGNGIPDLVLGSAGQMGFCSLPAHGMPLKRWQFVPVSDSSDPHANGSFKYYHGLGVGDLNRDGRNDIIIPHGWYEAPQDRDRGTWTFHPMMLVRDGETKPVTASDIHVCDLDLDGDQDILMSCAHQYGIWWFENLGSSDHTRFQYHVISESFSQTHALCLADVDGDGNSDLVTGKRFFAHNGGDPGGKDSVVMVWIEIARQHGKPPKFTVHEIDAGRDTGIGTQFQVYDVTGDGLLDVVLANKKGVNLLVQHRRL